MSQRKFSLSSPLPTKSHISLRAAMGAVGPSTLFHLPISNIALQQLIVLAEDLSSTEATIESDFW